MTLNVPPPFDLLFLSDTQIAKPKGLYLAPWASSVLAVPLETAHSKCGGRRAVFLTLCPQSKSLLRHGRNGKPLTPIPPPRP